MTDSADTRPLLQWLDPLTDAARLRLLYLLEGQELSVGELASALQLPQSTISRHLKRLLDAGWVVRRSEGTASLYRRATTGLNETARTLWSITETECRQDPACKEDARRAAEIIASRSVDSRHFFGTVGGEWTELRREMFGSVLEQEPLLALLDPTWTIADLGCGTGASAAELAPWVSGIEAIDREAAMLAAAQKRLAAHDHVRFHEADLLSVPLDDDAVDAALISLVLHHVPEPDGVLREAARIVRSGGPIIVIDMIQHQREAYRDTMGHVHLGFSEDEIAGWAAECGGATVSVHRLRPDSNANGPGLFVARLQLP